MNLFDKADAARKDYESAFKALKRKVGRAELINMTASSGPFTVRAQIMVGGCVIGSFGYECLRDLRDLLNEILEDEGERAS